MSNRERRDDSEAYREIPERRSECKEPDRNHYTPEVRERVHMSAIGQVKQQRAKAQVAELCSGETQHSQHGHEHSKQ